MKTSGEKKFRWVDILKNKYAMIVLAAGLLLLLLPTGSKTQEKTQVDTAIAAPAFSITAEEARLEKQLGQIKGAGKGSVLLSVEGSASRELAVSGEETLVVSENGDVKVVELYYVNPKYKGAVIVCAGADSAAVRLNLTRAVCAYTGLSTDKITVMGMS